MRVRCTVYVSCLFWLYFQAVIDKVNLSSGAAECFYLFETVEHNFGK